MARQKQIVVARRILPDAQVCKADDLTERFAECLVEKPIECLYAIPFGYSFLCGNPDRELIIKRTRPSKNQNQLSVAQLEGQRM
jgi:hypothetical protein